MTLHDPGFMISAVRSAKTVLRNGTLAEKKATLKRACLIDSQRLGNAKTNVFEQRKMQRGFTLLELLLTLAMSVVLMVMIGGAIRFYGRDMDLRNLDMRQTQLAASILQMIEKDLRSTVHAEPLDTQPLAELLSSVGGGDADEDLSAAGIDRSSDLTGPELSTQDDSSGFAHSTKTIRRSSRPQG